MTLEAQGIMSENRPVPLRVLLVEDSADDATLVLAALRRSGYAPQWERVEIAAAMAAALARQTWDCILADYELPRFSGLDALRVRRESGLDLPFIVVSGAIGEETAVAAMKAGAQDYVMKDNLARLGPAIARELQEAEVRGERRRAAAALEEDATVAAALGRVGQELMTSLDSPGLMNDLCRVTAEVLQCDACHTLFWQPQEEVFRPIAGYGGTAEEQETVRLVTVPGSLMQGLLSRLEHDDVAEVHTIPLEVLTRLPQRATAQLCMALRHGRELIGIHVATRYDKGRPFGTTHARIARGITQLASLALGHARVREELERSNRLKSDFVATMSHELRTPLNIIMGYNDLLQDAEFGPVTPEQADILRHIGKSAGQLLGLITATLDLGRLEKGQVSLDLQPVHLADMLREIAAEARDQREATDVHFVCDVPLDLPPFQTDPGKLNVILRNMIANAFKFTERGTVTVAARAHQGGVEIAVSDTGVGIAPDILPIIFEPYRQGERSMTRRFGGVGLGLYIVRRLLDLLTGTITVDSTVGCGSTFTVWIPNHPLSRPNSRPAGDAVN